MDQVNIQYQNKTGSWATVMVVQNLSTNIVIAMRSVAQANPGCRVRAVDQSGRVVDIL